MKKLISRIKNKKANNIPTVDDTKPVVETKKIKKSFSFKSLKSKFSNLSKKKKISLILLVTVLATVVALLSIPKTRYVVYNAIGSADMSLAVVNAESKAPIGGALVELANGDSATTNNEGIAFFNDTKYGSTTATISRDSYETKTVIITIASDNIDIGKIEVVPTGIPVKVTAVNWLTNSSIADFTATSKVDESIFESVDGVVVLNIPVDATGIVEFTISGEGYNDVQLSVDTDKIDKNPADSEKATKLQAEMIISGKHHFISNRDGKISFYSSNFDGTDVEELVKTTQDDYLEYYPVPDTENLFAALLKSEKSKGGNQDQLAIISPEKKKLDVIDEAAGKDLDFSIISVTNKRIIYSLYYNEARDDKYKIKSYNFETGKLTTHYTAPSSMYGVVFDEERNNIYINEQFGNYKWVSSYSRALIKVNLEKNEREWLLESTTLSYIQVNQSKPDKLLYYLSYAEFTNAKRGYYLMDLADNSKIEYLGENYPDFDEPDEIPDSEKGQTSPTQKNRVWIDNRDGKNYLILNDETNVLHGQVDSLSVNSIIRWVSDTVLTIKGYDGVDSADYIVDIETGNFRKITNSLQSQYGH